MHVLQENQGSMTIQSEYNFTKIRQLRNIIYLR